MVDALVRIDERKDPIQIDYFQPLWAGQGQVQLGIFQWAGQEACINMAAPGQPYRPTLRAQPEVVARSAVAAEGPSGAIESGRQSPRFSVVCLESCPLTPDPSHRKAVRGVGGEGMAFLKQTLSAIGRTRRSA